MPETEVLIYQEADGTVPLKDWLADLQKVPRLRCLAIIDQLRKYGYELRRPQSENIGDGLYELRVKVGHVNFRMLYFFHGRTAAVVSHGFTKEKKLPPGEIRVAARADG